MKKNGFAVPNIKILKISKFFLFTGLSLSALAFLFMIGAGPGHHFFNFSLKFSFQLFTLSGYQSIIAFVLLILASVTLSLTKQFSLLKWVALGLVFAVPIASGAIRMKKMASLVPRIHDITTDFSEPPQFVSLLPIREKCPNGSAYGGPAVSEQQMQKYAHIFPVEIAESPEIVFDKSLTYAKEMGWEIMGSNKSTGRIEATDTSVWFGFKDDVVIRLRKTESGTKIDIRSASREGISDLGVNAKRIHKFFQKFIQ